MRSMSGFLGVLALLDLGAFNIISRRSLFLIIFSTLFTAGVLNTLLSQFDVSVGEA